MKTTKVYVAKNKVNGGEYIGVTNATLARRRGQHEWDAKNGRGYCRKFAAALLKYGASAFDWSVIAEFEHRDAAIAREIEEIAARKPRYNITAGGPGVIAPRTDEWRQNISKGHIGKKMSKEAIENWRKAMTPEVRARIKQKMRERGFPPQAHAASVASRSKPVVCIETGTVFSKARVAGMAHGLKPGHVHDCISQNRVSGIAGVSFRYATPSEAGKMNAREA